MQNELSDVALRNESDNFFDWRSLEATQVMSYESAAFYEKYTIVPSAVIESRTPTGSILSLDSRFLTSSEVGSAYTVPRCKDYEPKATTLSLKIEEILRLRDARALVNNYSLSAEPYLRVQKCVNIAI
jgi:hypothetical protein